MYGLINAIKIAIRVLKGYKVAVNQERALSVGVACK
jgi:hypothetical protein